MILNRSNYEIWLIDYLDCNLDEIRLNQLFSFLEENPDLRQEFEDISGFKIIHDGNPYVNKNLLKKTPSDISSEQFDFLCVAEAENDLDPEQKDELGAIVREDQERKKIMQTKYHMIPSENGLI